MIGARLRAAFIAVTAAWAVLLVAVPYLASRAHASPLASALILGVYAVGSVVCHQLPERSYQLWTAQMPVCARCAGIYAGAVAGAIASTFRTPRLGRAGPATGRRTLGPRGVRLALALAVTPTLLTLLYEWTAGIMPAHAIRAAAGVPIGLVIAWLIGRATGSENR
jgi:hypothetical protein